MLNNFKRLPAFSLILLIFLLSSVIPSHQDNAVNEFVFKRGTNISHWLSQSSKRGTDRQNYFTEKDVKYLADLGFDHIRIPVDEEQLWKEDGQEDGEGFSLLKNALDWCKKYNLDVIVDLHILRSHHFNQKAKPLWTELAAQERFFQCWRDLSKELRNYPVGDVAYELMNEPVADDPEEWNKLVKKAVAVIRDAEPARKIVIGSNRWQSANTFDQLHVPENDKNIILSFHMYEPFLLTHHTASWTRIKDYKGPVNYPGVIVREEDLNGLPDSLRNEVLRNKKSFNIDSIRQHFKKPIGIAKKYNLPLYCGERVFRKTENLDYTVPDLFAGSILDLTSNTEYECRFTITDPDGVKGETVHTVKVRTRGEPKESKEGRILHVYPVDWKGKKEEPSFLGLKAAYYGSGLGDWSVVSERKAKPGDIILMHAGMYKADRLNYVEPNGIPFDGTYVLTLKGTVDKPIVIKGADDGETIIDGAGAHWLFDVTASANNIFENLTIRNADIAFMAGQKDVIGAKDLTVRNCRIENVGIAITTENAGSKNFYIADNVIIGREDRYRVRGWATPGLYPPSLLEGYFAIKVYGSGHVICHNSIAFFHDGITISTYGTPETDRDLKAVAIDIYNNDIHLVVDDFIEADGGVHNIRVMRNRGVNAGQCGLSAQPVFGGPAYFIRNVLYNIPNGVALKFMAKPAGLYVLHNTIISENRNVEIYSNAIFRNNLFLGIDAVNRPVTAFPMATSYSTYDYNGYRPNKTGGNQYLWISPPIGQLRNYDLTGKDVKEYATLKNFSDESGLEKHGVEIDFDIFANMHPPDPSNPFNVYHAADLDFTLNSKGKAIDKAVVLSNINDGFRGSAPDLGANEAGKPVPVYGARGIGSQPFYR